MAKSLLKIEATKPFQIRLSKAEKARWKRLAIKRNKQYLADIIRDVIDDEARKEGVF